MNLVDHNISLTLLVAYIHLINYNLMGIVMDPIMNMIRMCERELRAVCNCEPAVIVSVKCSARSIGRQLAGS